MADKFILGFPISDKTADSVLHQDNSNVGIGTASPSAKLDVNGAGNFSGGTVVSGIDTHTNVGIAIARGDFLKSNDGNYLRNIIGQTSGGIIEIGQGGTGLITDINFKPGTSGNINFYGSGSLDMRVATSGNVGIGTTSPASGAKLTVMGNQSFGLPGNGSNTNGRFISIEGNADSAGEGSSRIFFTEHNSSTAGMDKYGLSIGYRGGSTSIAGASGNTWTGLSQIGNGEWGLFGHDNDASGRVIMKGFRGGTSIDFNANTLGNAAYYKLRAGNGLGINFWNSTSYSIYMSSATSSIRLDTTSDYNMYFKMSSGTNRGFVFMNSGTPVAQIDSTGTVYAKGGIDYKKGATAPTRQSGSTGLQFWSGTKAQYTALTKDSNTIYYVTDE